MEAGWRLDGGRVEAGWRQGGGRVEAGWSRMEAAECSLVVGVMLQGGAGVDRCRGPFRGKAAG